MKPIHILALLSTLAASRGALPAPASVDPNLPHYVEPEQPLSGPVVSVGSSTVGNLLNRWSEAFRATHPDVTFEISGAGSGTAPPALISGAAALAPMSRPMNEKELASFRAAFGYDPTRITVAIDALAVFVNADNPIESLSLQEIDAIFSADRKRGGEIIETWGDLGLQGEWADMPLIVYGFRDTAGGYALFGDLVLKGGDYRPDISVQPGSSAIVNGIGAYPNAIGYASQFFQTRSTRMVPIRDEAGLIHAPDAESCEHGKYPLARELFIYINRAPGKPLEPRIEAFLTFILSHEGQTIAAEDGNFPLSQTLAAEQLAKLRD